MNLQEQYKEETSKDATESVEGWVVFTDDYVEWLEDELIKQLTLTDVGNSTSLKEMLVDFGNVVRNSKGQEVELLADAYIVYDRIKDEKEQ
tara:strand:+ start:223 stop:495 length:273 start_codon:yes stop_codon:yes gene_type:complete